MKKSVLTSMTVATLLMASHAAAQTAIFEDENTKDEVNLREDGPYDRSIGQIMPGEVQNVLHARQRYQGNVEAGKTTTIDDLQSYQINSAATGNALNIDLTGSLLTKSKQRQKGNVTSRLETRMENEAIEVTLGSAAIGNSVTINNTGTQIADAKQRQDGGRIEAIVITELALGNEDEDSLEASAVALGNSFFVTGPDKNFGGDIDQRNDADIEAYNETSGNRGTPRVQSTAVGNSISISRK